MYAMIATSIGLGIWTAGLSYMTAEVEKRRKREMEDFDGIEQEAKPVGADVCL